MTRVGEIALFTADVDRLVEWYEDHVAFLVEDVDAESEALRGRDLTAETRPRDFSWGRSAYFRDPDGRQVELHRPPGTARS